MVNTISYLRIYISSTIIWGSKSQLYANLLASKLSLQLTKWDITSKTPCYLRFNGLKKTTQGNKKFEGVSLNLANKNSGKKCSLFVLQRFPTTRNNLAAWFTQCEISAGIASNHILISPLHKVVTIRLDLWQSLLMSTSPSKTFNSEGCITTTERQTWWSQNDNWIYETTFCHALWDCLVPHLLCIKYR